jgi:single-strand DNA-binding protein
MAYLNKLTLIGNLGKDPELRYTPDGTSTCRFSVAVTERYNSAAGEKMERTDWFHVTAWKQLAETCSKFLHKGSRVYLEGPFHERKYTDEHGVERRIWEMRLMTMQMLDNKPKGNGDGGEATPADEVDEPAKAAAPDANLLF